jgi:hypothetical protein
MEIGDIEKVINEWTNVYLKRGTQPGIKYVQIFEVIRLLLCLPFNHYFVSDPF